MMTLRSSRSIKNFLDWVIKLRFIIAILFVAVFVIFKLNMSSIGLWNSQLTNDTSKTSSSVVLGTPKAIRFDEWKVQTPFYLAQSANGFKLVNKNMSKNGQNMVLNYNGPVFDLSAIGKPFNWGMFFLGRDRGLSWYWSVKLAGIILLAFEFCLILTKKKYLSLLGSFWIAFSPAVQWWFMQHLGDLTFFTLAIIVTLYHLFWQQHSLWWNVLGGLFFTSSVIGFILVIYPAFQVPFAYFIMAMLIGLLFSEHDKFHFNKTNVGLLLVSVIVISVVLINFYSKSSAAINTLLNTAYPGKRVSLGGSSLSLGNTYGSLFNYLVNWKLPYSSIPFSNVVEASTFFNMLPLVLLFIPRIVSKMRQNAVFIAILIQTFGLIIWYFVKFPRWFAKATLMSYVTSERTLAMIGFGSMIMTIWFISWVWDYYTLNSIKKNTFCIIVGIIFVFYAWAVVLGQMQTAIFGWETIIVMVVVLIVISSLLKRWYVMFGFSMLLIIGFSGIPVNTVTVGTSAIFNQKIVKTIQKINKKTPNLTWISGTTTSNLLPMLNVKSIGNTNFIPDLEMWHKIDTKKKNEIKYNRYVNVTINFVPQTSQMKFSNPSPDSLFVDIRPGDLKKLGVKRVLTTQNLHGFSTKKIKFKQLASVDQNKIYSVKYR